MKKISLAFISVLFAITVFGQFQPAEPTNRISNDKKTPFRDRLFFGGGLGLQFGDITIIDVSPLIGVNITDALRGGIGFTYWYFEDSRPGIEFNTTILGGRSFAQHDIYESVFAHLEVEMLNGEFALQTEAITITSIFIGGGYRAMIGGRSFFNALLLYNINDSVYSPYQNPVIRVGFGFGI